MDSLWSNKVKAAIPWLPKQNDNHPKGSPLLLLLIITNMADGNEVVVSKKAKAAFCGKFRILISVFVVKGFRTNAALYIQVMYRRKKACKPQPGFT